MVTVILIRFIVLRAGRTSVPPTGTETRVTRRSEGKLQPPDIWELIFFSPICGCQTKMCKCRDKM